MRRGCLPIASASVADARGSISTPSVLERAIIQPGISRSRGSENSRAWDRGDSFLSIGLFLARAPSMNVRLVVGGMELSASGRSAH